MKLSKVLLTGIGACLILFSSAAFAQPESPCNPCVTYCSFTQGGWGAPCQGGNAGCLRDECFDDIYPNGVTIGNWDDYPGGCCWIHLTSAQAVEDFLPQGTTPEALTQNYTDPGVCYITVFAGQVLALQLNVDLGAYGCGSMVPIGDLEIADGPFAGWTISELLAAANQALGGGALPEGHTIEELNDAATAINENFDDCQNNDGYIEIPPQGETVYINDPGESFPISFCLDFAEQCSDFCVIWWCPFPCDELNQSTFTWLPGCAGPDCDVDCDPVPGNVTWGDQTCLGDGPGGYGSWWYAVFHSDDAGCACVTWEFQLAVNLINFSATPGNAEVSLSWATASERDNDYFDLQRSINGSSWATIGHVDGQGTATGTTHYTFVDNSVTNGTEYSYKLMTVDMSGNVAQAGDVVLSTPSENVGAPTEFALYQNYPNPFNPTTSITFDLVESGFVSLTVYNMLGQEIAVVVNGVRDAGRHVVTFDATGMPSGLYLYRIEANGFVTQRKMLLMK